METLAGNAPPPSSPPRLRHEPTNAGVALVAGAEINQYELIREIGRGGMGMVWAARDTVLGRKVAIKFLVSATRLIAERFLTEARATAQCSHDNIVIIHAVDELDDTPYMVLEFLEGQPLREMMGAPLPASRVVEIALPIARALARAHELGIVHRDLKPENVFVTSAGQIKVFDFGIAKALGSTDRMAAVTGADAANVGGINLTSEGTMLGTLPYMPPEQMGHGEVDERSDLWALGIMMYEMLAGRHPVEPLTITMLLAQAASELPVTPIRDVAPTVPESLALLVDRCLRKPKVERFASSLELVYALEALQPGRAGRALGEGESPYPGLTAFQESDANRFFGRSRDVGRMVARIRELPLTGVIGPSGAGKSSFVRAGIGPALKASGEQWDVVTLRPGRQPLAALASIVHRLTTGAPVTEHRELVERLRTEPGLVGTLLRNRARQSGAHILLFVDQFEELYTLVPSADERRAFTAALAAVADDTAAPLRVVVSMRSDFLDRTTEDPRFLEELTRGLVFLSTPDRDALREALVAPIELVNYRFESSAMVADMLDALDGTPAALPLLQFAAAKLWDARDRDRRLLTVASYNAIGGISGALAAHADDVVEQMNTAAQKLTQRVFRSLVTPERTRAIVELEELYRLAPDRAEVTRVVEQLVAARLLVVQDTGGGSVEIVHESLIDRWPMLRRWLDEDQEDTAYLAQLALAAKQWQTMGESPGLLWRGEAMAEARHWIALRPRELPAREQAFLDEVFALARRGQRAKRVGVIVTIGLLGAIAAGAIIAFLWVRGAESREQAEAARANDALEKMQQKEQQRLAAERETSAAQAEKTKAQTEVVNKTAELGDTREALAAKNVVLEKAIRETSAARERAEHERIAAEQTAADLKKARDQLQAANAKQQAVNAKQQAEIAKLNEDKKKLSSTLK